jgi:hypothetical protein
MLTDAEVKRLKEVKEEYSSIGQKIASLRGMRKYGKEKKSEEQILLRKKEMELWKVSDSLVEERRALEKKRDGNWGPSNDSYSPYYDHKYGVRTDW